MLKILENGFRELIQNNFFFDTQLDVPNELSNGKIIGLMTRRFLDIYADYRTNAKGQIEINSIKLYVNFWVNQDDLYGSTKKAIKIISQNGEFYNENYTINNSVVNNSAHLDYHHYYNDKLKNKVFDMDNLIFEILNEIQKN